MKNVHISLKITLWLTEQDNITGITTRKRKTLIKLSCIISWEEKNIMLAQMYVAHWLCEIKHYRLIYKSVMRQFDTHGIRAGIARDVQEQYTAENKKESQTSKMQGNKPVSLM